MRTLLERQRWLGALGLAVAVPLPFTGVVTWPFLLPFIAIAFAALAAKRPLKPLPTWLENLLAPLILFGVVAAGGGWRFGILRPVAQLAVLVAAVRMIGGHERRRAGTALLLLTLVGVAGIASSTHPLLAVYLLALLTLVVASAARLSTVSLADDVSAARRTSWPPVRLVAATVVLATLIAAPIFALFPRLRSPFAAVPLGARSVSGFREAVSLHGIGEIKESRARVLHVTFPGGRSFDPEWLRLTGTTLRHYRSGLWAQGRKNQERLAAGAAATVQLTDSPPRRALQRAEIVMEKGGDTLFAPPGTARLELPEGVPVWFDPVAGLRVPRFTEPPVRYAVEFDPAAVLQSPPDAEDVRLPAGAEPVLELAAEVAAGAGSKLAEALAIEQHLRDGYGYSNRLGTDLPLRKDPVNWFLFESRTGHCEFFASSMVMLLRARGIPARLQAGYAGGEADGDGFVLRDSNAHAWVVAHVAGAWRVFDPTPAIGRPGIGEGPTGWRVRLGWDVVEAAWDRWVLTFSLRDQLDLLRLGWELVYGRWRLWPRLLAALAGAALLLVLGRRLLARVELPRVFGPRDGLARALDRLIALARRRGMVGPEAVTPRAFAATVGAALPEAERPLRWLVVRHERAAYAGGPPPPRREVAAHARAAARALAQKR